MTQVLEISKVQLQGDTEKEFDLNQIPNFIIDPNEEIPEPPSAWLQETENEDRIMGTLGNFSVLTGKAKSKKSFLMAFITSILFRSTGQFKGALPENKKVVLYFDTEQGKYHAQKINKTIIQLSDGAARMNFKLYYLRKFDPSIRLKIIEHEIYKTENLGFVVIDGVKDIVFSINDENDAVKCSADLLKWTEELNIHILTVLHQNKANNYARGHLGTELINKAETVLSVAVSEENKDISVVTPEHCRNKEPEPFAFQLNTETKLPELVEDYQLKTQPEKKISALEIEDFKKLQLFNAAFSKNKSYGYGDLVVAIKEETFLQLGRKFGDNKVKEIISQAKNKKWIYQKGRPYFQTDNTDKTDNTDLV